ncbi:MAG: flavodoxin [Oscillospiraceae bacterium]
MKKSIIALMSLLLVFTFSSCQKQNSQDVSESSKSSESSDVTEQSGGFESAPPESQSSESESSSAVGKTLVVYFSASGNTKEAAQFIAAAVDGDLFELVPVEPYSASDLNWNDENSRVINEYNHPEKRNVELIASSVENWDEYDTVFIGYPIWWGIAAWPVNSFIEANDFTGKTVIPFCTSTSSGLGDSGNLLKEAAGTGEWLEGKRFKSGASESEIDEWVGTLEL